MSAGEAPEQKEPGGLSRNLRICSAGPITAVLFYFFPLMLGREKCYSLHISLPDLVLVLFSSLPGDAGASSHGTWGTCRPRNR